ncbi:CDP-alcohol phosphatidyltransferase family protein [Enterococcus timonensis]|uniref:CDP-alcohol phosphatidyltransferase family protein n=1 Tax=Enterococcus timonensis TaxID=1852364 RepID=UPI0008DA3186|nr:CDP-alcohol phosphatidyltransferase family protein [Enterococcus timonensis]
MQLTKKEFKQDLSKKIDWNELLIYFSASYLISNRISPDFSYYFIKKGTKPNRITLYMIISGILGGLFFMFPFLWAKIVGAILIQLWFILDCSDGEVARYTKTFSKFGSELDFLAHMIDHPFFCISFALSLIQLNLYPAWLVLATVFGCLFLDSTMRNLITLEKFTDEPSEKTFHAPTRMTLKNWLKTIFNTFLFFPNVILFGVLVYFIDFAFGTPFFLILLLGNFVTSLIIILLKLKRKLNQYYFN